MISSNGLIIIEMVSSETVDRGTVLFILKGETCLNGICHGAFGEVYGRSFVCFLVGMVLFGSVAKVALVWDLADLFMALMAITNLVAIAILGKYAYIALHDYMEQKRAGIVEPEFDPAILPSQRGIEVWKKE